MSPEEFWKKNYDTRIYIPIKAQKILSTFQSYFKELKTLLFRTLLYKKKNLS